MSAFWLDVRYGLRLLGKTPGFTIVAVLTLALGIGANTALFSVVDAVLLAPLPYPAGERLVTALRNQPGPLRTMASYPDFTDWVDSGVFAKAAAVVGKSFFLDTGEGTIPLSGRRVTDEFFAVLDVHPMLGRGFLPDDLRQDAKVAVISHALWTTHLGSDPGVVGRDLRLRDLVVVVIGVLPPEFVDPLSPLAARDVYAPLVASAEERGPGGRNSQWLQVVGRLRDGITLDQAAARVQAASERAQKEVAGSDPRSLAPFTLVSLRDYQVGDSERALWMLLGAVGFVLLIGCANVSNLLLARFNGRQHELAVRAAVGASARRLAAQLMTEGLLLSLTGGAVALLLVVWVLDLIKQVRPAGIPRLDAAGLDPRVFGFALAVSVAAGLLLGLLPMLRGARQDVLGALKQSSGTGSAAHARSRSALLVVEVALTMVLLVGATLAITSLRRLLSVDPGFDPHRLLAVNLTHAGEWTPPAQQACFDQLLARVGAMPGVQAAGVVDNLPYSGAWSQYTTTVQGFAEGVVPELVGKTLDYQQGVIAGDYFRALAVPLRAGRYFDARDDAPGAASVILSESLARTLWGDADPIGKLVHDRQTQRARVVGVVGDVRHFGPETPLVRTLYRPLSQRQAWGGTLVVRADGDPTSLVPAIRASLLEIDRAVVFQRARTMDEYLELRTAAPRFLAILLGSFGAVALVLASLGIYGVLAHAVSQRTREIGVRIALGARPTSVLGMVVRNAMLLTGIGMGVGLASALALSRLLRGQLFEVSPTDPGVYAGVALLLAAVALLACWVPARRAARVDPLVALRCE
ncbi:MAG TPA: ABC transporter permease [Candidatus Polarisedimenticolaceae bacterium]|nr:ABC transporter permease [Candidatus Polarisedimenticolaceae bacterium]